MRIGKSGIVRMPVCRRTAKAEDPDRPGRFADRKPLHIEIRSAQRDWVKLALFELYISNQSDSRFSDEVVNQIVPEVVKQYHATDNPHVQESIRSSFALAFLRLKMGGRRTFKLSEDYLSSIQLKYLNGCHTMLGSTLKKLGK